MRENKVPNFFEFSYSDVIALEDPRECVLLSNDISFGSPDNIFCEVIMFVREITEHSGVTSVNNLPRDATQSSSFNWAKYRRDSTESGRSFFTWNKFALLYVTHHKIVL